MFSSRVKTLVSFVTGSDGASLNEFSANVVGVPQCQTQHVEKLDSILEYRLGVVVDEEVRIDTCNSKSVPLVEGELIPECTSAYFHFPCTSFAKEIKDPFQ